jgi:hypothetical protein
MQSEIANLKKLARDASRRERRVHKLLEFKAAIKTEMASLKGKALQRCNLSVIEVQSREMLVASQAWSHSHPFPDFAHMR